MDRGTKSLLFGCHQFLIHPLFVLAGWIRLYGLATLNFQVLVAIFYHDWGYWGCKSMDGVDGVMHPFCHPRFLDAERWDVARHEIRGHSTYLCRYCLKIPSNLCWADKMGTALVPSILWALLAVASGEGWEYMENTTHGYVSSEKPTFFGLVRFHRKIKIAMRKLVEEEIGGGE